MSELIDKMRRRGGRWLDVRPAPVRPERGIFSLSFDDIPVTAWTEAGPVLAEHGIRATYYVCGGLESGTNLGLPQFTTDHLQALFAAGHEVGCHTFGHTSALRSLAVRLRRRSRPQRRLGGRAAGRAPHDHLRLALWRRHRGGQGCRRRPF
ncbi:polysaccharide deacetylase family protein [Brevundimonas sp. R86498]|uniref:polysaccharide deacetylase family protein n=1 Tax=Brevundimonas sp. R86498 TaxID=3093845 RepID=UPI0037C5661C